MALMRRLALTLAVLALPLLAFQAPPKKDTTKPATKPAATKPAATKGTTPGKAAAKPAEATAPEAPAGPRVYVAPFKGIWGLDIHPELCQKFVDDIKFKKPDLVVFTLDSQDLKEGFYTAERNEDGTGVFEDDSQRRMLKLLDEELRGTPTLMWVQDSWGFSTLLAFAFEDMYMKPGARLDGLGRIAERYGVEDPQVLAKFREAVVAIANGFFEVGGYDIMIGRAMMRPELKLSASWKGRDLVWSQDADGTWVVDGSEKGFAAFDAETAEDLGLADGSASDLGELMFLRGFREFQVVPSEQEPSMGAGEKISTDWTKAWNRAFFLPTRSPPSATSSRSMSPKSSTIRSDRPYFLPLRLIRVAAARLPDLVNLTGTVSLTRFALMLRRPDSYRIKSGPSSESSFITSAA